ncbi:Claudin-34 [Oryzias melastigma]|uniref:Claudin-34 n=1 Tax=Oryzias melastigma TaxID=30732 RepID=A0A834FIX7_ORYME|nr:Claudin-34 [Oryzias melastigma]
MTYLAHTAHVQFGALWMAFIGWTFTAVALGLIQWRVWLVSGSDVITSGVVWVGLWRTCFNSHTEVSEGLAIMHCKFISLTETFTPPEVAAGQVLMLLSLIVGLCGNAGGVYAMRNAYFGVKEYSCVRLGFVVTGAFCLLAAVMSLIPLLWNLSSVVANQTIHFPPEFRLPQAPESQHVGCGIWVGMVGTVLMGVSGIIFSAYRVTARFQHRIQPSLREQLQQDSSAPSALDYSGVGVRGQDNRAFEFDDHL